MRAAAGELAGKAAVIQVNTDENPQLAARFGVRGIPALFAVSQGQVLGQTSGGMGKDAILEWFGRFLPSRD